MKLSHSIMCCVLGFLISANSICVATPGNKLIDVVVFSFNRSLQLYAFLESLEKYIPGVHCTTVIYRATDDAHAKSYEIVSSDFPKVHFWKQSDNPYADFKPLVNKAVFDSRHSQASYILFGVDDIVVKDEVDLQFSIEIMNKVSAYGVYLRLGKHVDKCYLNDRLFGVPDSVKLGQGYCTWSFSEGSGDWRYPNTVDMTLYRKEDIKETFTKLKFKDPNTLELQWSRHADLSRKGVCFESSKIVNLPFNIVRKNSWETKAMHTFTAADFLKIFNEGKKIDILPLYQINNHSAHMDYEPVFVER